MLDFNQLNILANNNKNAFVMPARPRTKLKKKTSIFCINYNTHSARKYKDNTTHRALMFTTPKAVY